MYIFQIIYNKPYSNIERMILFLRVESILKYSSQIKLTLVPVLYIGQKVITKAEKKSRVLPVQ